MEAATAGGAVVVHKLRNKGLLTREDFDGGPVSIDQIEPGFYLGNLSAATHMETLKLFKISHILTLDSVPLPQHILDASFLTCKFIHIADMPKEDILHHLDPCVDFIKSALDKKENILVHCYFGVSRSSSAVIAYIMKRYNMNYQEAYELVQSKRRFVQPNPGFVTQLKLYKRMGCTIDPYYPKYKMYRLRLAGEQIRAVKILPQSFHNVVKPDPAITQENPEPIGYRCRRCRRLLAAKSHVLVHNIKNAQQNPQTITCAENSTPAELPSLLNQIATQLRQTSVLDTTENVKGVHEQTPICKNIIFIEPIAWMRSISNNIQGRLYCPKCEQKLGNFSWINGCQCPCGEIVSPAFYLIPSKVELSKAVQNVQTTI